MSRELRFFQALREATDLCLAADPAVYLMGLGVPDPKGIFGSTLGLQAKYGDRRVFDLPTSENGMTGVAIGSAITGMRPILTHQRLDFALLAVEQMVNQAAKWHYMFGGRMKVPMVVRMIVGRGWGQGPQHSQSLHAWFAHVPGLKVVLPTTPHDAKGLLIASVEDDNPVLFIEHRWLYNITGPVPEGTYRVPIGRARVMREGHDVTILGISYMALESVKAADQLAVEGIHAEVLDLRSLRPWDEEAVLASVRKTGRMVVADIGWRAFGAGAELIARATEECLSHLKAAPVRLGMADCPAPTSPALARGFYPRAHEIAAAVRRLLGRPPGPPEPATSIPHDVPDPTFKGPF